MAKNLILGQIISSRIGLRHLYPCNRLWYKEGQHYLWDIRAGSIDRVDEAIYLRIKGAKTFCFGHYFLKQPDLGTRYNLGIWVMFDLSLALLWKSGNSVRIFIADGHADRQRGGPNKTRKQH